LKRGENALITMQFTATKQVDELKLPIAALIGPIWVPISLDDTEHCQMTVGIGQCPLKPNTTYTYRNFITIPKELPIINLVIRYQLNDLYGSELACLMFPVRIV
jgi:hypothetical protein